MRVLSFEQYIQPLLKKAENSRFVSLLLLPLTLLSFVFFCCIFIRKKILLCKRSRRSLEAKVVTVGNISVGGTGKTPFLQLLLQKIGEGPVAYVSRGYRRKERKAFVGKGSACTAALCGDEASQIAKRFPNVCVSVAQDKWEAIEQVKNVPLIFLDDGLQRYDIPIDIQIATVDVACPDGYGGLLPRGLLREPLSRLREVDYIVLTNVQNEDQAERLCDEYSLKYSRPVIACQTKISRFFDGSGKTVVAPQKVALFSAVASPQRVRALMEQSGFLVVDHAVFPDHMDIDLKILYTFCVEVCHQGAKALIGTEKDFARKDTWGDFPLPLLFSQVDFEVVAGKRAFEELILHIEGTWK